MIKAQNAVLVSFSHELWKIDQPNLLDMETRAVLKMNCQITPKTTPPIRFGTKKKVLKIFSTHWLAESYGQLKPNSLGNPHEGGNDQIWAQI
jgi:hypothetical protein